MVVTALTMDFIGVSMHIGTLEQPTERSKLMAVKKAVRCTHHLQKLAAGH
jgi:hypothetical protein